jgi:hypothetical protein
MLVVVGYTAETLAAVRHMIERTRPGLPWVDMADTQHTGLCLAAREERK